MPQISIIVPVYKVEQYLDRCVTSILNQTFTDFELILVDDGSPDRCPQMCDEWAQKDARIRVIHKKNGGLSSARNVGLKIINGHYVSFVDSDDWLETDAIQYLYDLRNRYDADFAFAEMNCTRNEHQKCVIKTQTELVLSQEQFLLQLFKVNTQANVQYACAKLYRANLFSQVRYPEGLTSEDVPTMFDVAILCKRIAYGSKVIYNYFIHEDSITQSAFSKKNFDLLIVWDMVCKSAETNNCEQWIIDLAKINRHRADFGVLCQFLLAKNYIGGCEIYAEKIKQIRAQLKKELLLLLNAKIPLSRKVFAVILAEVFPVIFNLFSLCKKVQK